MSVWPRNPGSSGREVCLSNQNWKFPELKNSNTRSDATHRNAFVSQPNWNVHYTLKPHSSKVAGGRLKGKQPSTSVWYNILNWF